jgi:hypothetical protein
VSARRLRLALGPPLALAWLLAGGRAVAHPTPGSAAFVDFTVDGARVEQDVPVEELERALHRRLAEAGESPEGAVGRHRDLLRAYAGEHLRASSAGGGRPWGVEVTDVTGHPSDSTCAPIGRRAPRRGRRGSPARFTPGATK